MHDCSYLVKVAYIQTLVDCLWCLTMHCLLVATVLQARPTSETVTQNTHRVSIVEVRGGCFSMKTHQLKFITGGN